MDRVANDDDEEEDDDAAAVGSTSVISADDIATAANAPALALRARLASGGLIPPSSPSASFAASSDSSVAIVCLRFELR